MIRIGEYNRLRVARTVDFGAYLVAIDKTAADVAIGEAVDEAVDEAADESTDSSVGDDSGQQVEVLLPAKFFPGGKALREGDEVDVFVYTDSEDRPIATTESPLAQVGEVAVMRVADVNRHGAFLDWGLEAKHLFVPFAEQQFRLRPGMTVAARVYLDELTRRPVATVRPEHMFSRERPAYKMGDEVDALVIEQIPRVGFKAVVDNRFRGFFYESDLSAPLAVGSRLKACVKYVRDDNKIDLTAGARVEHRLGSLADSILEALEKAPGGSLPLGDRSDPEAIKAAFGCSKKDFKRAAGTLMRSKKVIIGPANITLARNC